MTMLNTIGTFMSNHSGIAMWFGFALFFGAVFALFRDGLRARKIQPKGFRWKTVRNEAFFVAINLSLSGLLLGGFKAGMTKLGLITINPTPVAWWLTALEFTLYFFAFDTWFYWFHRWMHKQPIYSLVHKIHHYSTSPNPLTTLSVSPFESFVNGSFMVIFVMVVPTHASTMALIFPTTILMGFYVHSGYEFFPGWWNKSWATKWFITATFHDQHHKYFNYNFGGYTTIWDRICGTMRPKFEADYVKLKERVNRPAPSAPDDRAGIQPAPVTAAISDVPVSQVA